MPARCATLSTKPRYAAYDIIFVIVFMIYPIRCQRNDIFLVISFPLGNTDFIGLTQDEKSSQKDDFFEKIMRVDDLYKIKSPIFDEMNEYIVIYLKKSFC